MTATLIADNNPTTTACISRILKKYGHMIRTVNNAIDTWRAIGPECFDVVLVNADMPELDGLALAKKALLANPSAQIVFITGFSAMAMSRSGKPARPFHIRDIGRKLNSLWQDGAYEAAPEQKNGTVVYADFRARKTQR